MAVYTLFSQGATGSSASGDATAYTMGVQFSVSQAATLTAVWFYSAPAVTALPQTIALFAVPGASLVHSESASWSGAAGSGWVRAAFSSPPSLTSGTSYKACVLQDTAADWYSATTLYWSSGPGASGVTNGPLAAPDNASAAQGQDTFNANNTLIYPAASFNAANYWVDPEVTTTAAAPDAPQITPGPSWLRLFKPWAPRPVPPPASASPGITASGSLTLAPLAVSALGGQTSPDVPQARPGPVWLRLFRPWAQRPVPPLPGPSPQAAVTSAGSLALAPLALAGTGAQTSPDVPAVQPGPVWSRLFRPWAARPVPPPPAVQAVSAAGSLTLAPLGVAGAGSVKGGSPDQPQAQPGPVWLRLFKPWIPRPAPVNAGQGAVTITSSGGITLAPLKLAGNAEGPAPVVSFGGARRAWTFGAARNR